MPRLRLVVTGLLVVVVAAALVLTVAAAALVRRPLPDYSGTVAVPGLGAEVEIIRDERGIPQVYADDASDLFRAQGYVHAQDRFFEMDFRRHVTAGRLSELVGEDADALRADEMVRTLGWRRVAQAELPLLSPQTRDYLQAYADGVNDYLRDRSPSDLSVAYTVLGARVDLGRIEPWDPVDSLTWLKAMAWDLRSNYTAELGRALAFGAVGDVGQVEQLYPPYPADRNLPIIPGRAGATAGAALSGALRADGGGAVGTATPAASVQALDAAGAQDAFAAVSRALDAVPRLLGSGDGIGSNSWVVSGEYTATGKPLLANDPHLAPAMPSVWYQVGLHCRQVSEGCPFNVAGYSFSGLPGVVIGHNGDIAWAFTNLGADVTDFFLERVTGNTYLRDGAQVPLQVRTETIEVAGGSNRMVTIRTTAHGPILSDVASTVSDAGRDAPVPANAPFAGGYEVSLAWTALTPSRTADAIFALDRARNWDEFRAAAELFEVPGQNLLYADTKGHIGYQAPGRIPVRQPGSEPGRSDGTWPRAGWDSGWDWAGYIPFDQLPSELDPAEGFIVTANQAVTGSGYPHLITADYDYGYRSQRIRDVIEGWIADRRKISAADMSGLQMDTRNGFAPTLVPALLSTSLRDGTSVPEEARQFTADAVDLLRGWDYNETADSAAAAYYNAVWSNLLRLTFTDEPRGAVQPDGGSRWFEVVGALLQDPDSTWWDDKRTPTVVERSPQILGQAMYEARLELTTSLGKDPQSWRWGQLHQLSLTANPLGGDSVPAVVRSLFNPDPVRLAGGSSIVDATGWDASVQGSYAVNWAPSMRMVVDLANLDSSTWVDLTGVSGHPWSPHYGDQTDAWAAGETYPWPFGRTAVENAERDTLRLRPAPDGS